MKVMRIYADADGVARVEQRLVSMQPDSSGRRTSTRLPALDFFFRETPAEHARGKHCAPQRQFIMVVSGIGEIALDDGSKHRFGPGDILFAEDTAGLGHETHVLEGVRGFVHVAVADDFDITQWPLA
jgi:hypothetical protein